MNNPRPDPPPPRLVAPAAQGAERAAAVLPRPTSLDQFIGQEKTCANLRVFVQAAIVRKEPLDHFLLAGPPGLGKTTLAHILARARNAALRPTSGPALQRPGDLAALLTNLQTNDVLFIDEIHRLSPAVEELLYPALEDFALDLIIGEGPGARSVRVDLNPFTLAGATTRAGLLTTPLRDRFGLTIRLDFYPPEALEKIVCRAAGLLKVPVTAEAARKIAVCARGTPRIAERLLRRVHDFAIHEKAGQIDPALAARALARLEVDRSGLDALDRRYLRCLTETFAGQPTGIETLAAALGETRDTIEDTIEPYLLRQGFIARTPRGRVAAAAAWTHLGLARPPLPRARRPCLLLRKQPVTNQFHRLAVPRLSRGYRLHRPRLSRQLSALRRTGPLRKFARPRTLPCRTPRRYAPAGLRGQKNADRFPRPRSHRRSAGSANPLPNPQRRALLCHAGNRPRRQNPLAGPDRNRRHQSRFRPAPPSASRPRRPPRRDAPITTA